MSKSFLVLPCIERLRSQCLLPGRARVCHQPDTVNLRVSIALRALQPQLVESLCENSPFSSPSLGLYLSGLALSLLAHPHCVVRASTLARVGALLRICPAHACVTQRIRCCTYSMAVGV